MKITLDVTGGPMTGKSFQFTEHDTFLFGRSPMAACCLPDDPCVSRNHFLLEITPPECWLRDLGSLNGTFVNDVQYGRRKEERPVAPSAGANLDSEQLFAPAQAQLADGDRIRAGETTMVISMQFDLWCAECGAPIEHEDPAVRNNRFKDLCLECRYKRGLELARKARMMFRRKVEFKQRLDAEHRGQIRCAECGKDVTEESGAKIHGWNVQYVCRECRQEAANNPDYMIRRVLREVRGQQLREAAGSPSLSNYDVVRKIDEGAMGAVYLAKEKTTGKTTAIKILIPKVAAEKRAVDRFLREARISAELHHPHIVEFFDQGFEEGIFFIAMEYVEGINVHKLIEMRQNAVPPAEACTIICQVLDAIDYAHRQNIVHRDLKPPNILLHGTRPPWNAKVADFGLAKNFTQAGLSGQTVTGDVGGSLPFMPPEQVANYRYVKPESDIFAVGATLYTMLTGQFIHDFKQKKDPLLIILQDPVIPIMSRNSRIPQGIAEVIDRSLQADPADRYHTASEMKSALENVL